MKKSLLVLALVMTACVSSGAADVTTGIMDPYLRIQSALSTDTVKGLPADAELIATEAEKLGEAGEALHTAAKEVQAASDLPAARTAFGKLSDALLAYASATKSGVGAGVKVAYCPMVRKSWAQKGETLSNPYYGKSMLTCGEFKS